MELGESLIAILMGIGIMFSIIIAIGLLIVFWSVSGLLINYLSIGGWWGFISQIAVTLFLWTVGVKITTSTIQKGEQ